METQTQATTKISQDAFPINGTVYIEFYDGNAKQSAMSPQVLIPQQVNDSGQNFKF